MKLLATDFDGTFTFNGIQISKHNITAVNAFQKQHLFGFVTGRGYETICLPLKGKAINPDFFICYNGAHILDKTGQTLFKVVIQTPIKALCEALDHHVLYYTICNGESILIRYFPGIRQLKKQILLYTVFKVKLKKLYRITKTLSTFETNKAIHISCFAKSLASAHQLANTINTTFDDCVAICNGLHVDIICKGIDKTTGIAFIQEHFKLKKENVYTVGDNLNDLRMIQDYQGIAITSGVASIQPLAKYRCQTVDQAVAWVLKQKEIDA